MSSVAKLRQWLKRDAGVLVLLAFARYQLHTLTNSRYGFRRDELLTFTGQPIICRPPSAE